MVPFLNAARLAKSRPAKPTIPMMAKIESIEKLCVPGAIMITTPIKPIRIADHRCHPTFSLNTNAAPATTTNGVACNIIVAEDKGVKAMANI